MHRGFLSIFKYMTRAIRAPRRALFCLDATAVRAALAAHGRSGACRAASSCRRYCSMPYARRAAPRFTSHGNIFQPAAAAYIKQPLLLHAYRCLNNAQDLVIGFHTPRSRQLLATFFMSHREGARHLSYAEGHDIASLAAAIPTAARSQMPSRAAFIEYARKIET